MDLNERETKNTRYDEKLLKQEKQFKEFYLTNDLKKEERQAIRDRNLKKRKDFDEQKDQIGIQAMLKLKRQEKDRRDREIGDILKSKIKMQKERMKQEM